MFPASIEPFAPNRRAGLAAEARLVVVGAGAVGSEVCRLLIELGQRHVLVIDPDVIEERNLALSTLFQTAGPADAVLGRPKAQVVAEFAERQGLEWSGLDWSGLDWSAKRTEIADVGLAELRASDVLLCCTDSALSRVEAAYAARTLSLPMLDAGVRSHGLPEGRVAWFASAPAAACYLCGLSVARRAEILAYALSPSLGCGASPLFPRMSGSPLAVRAVAAAMLDLLGRCWTSRLSSGAQESFACAVQANAAGGAQLGAPVSLTLSPSCPWHTAPPQGTALLPLASGETFAAALKRFAVFPGGGTGELLLELPWPICLRAQCRSCHKITAPLRRAALVRRQGFCPHCAAASTLEPLDCAADIRLGDPLAEQDPIRLGLPQNQLYLVRRTLSAVSPKPTPPREPSSGKAGNVR